MPSADVHWLMSPRREFGHPPKADRGDAPADFPFGRRVLITEDNWLIASEWESALQDAGYTVVGMAVSADEGQALCLQEAPDFVLMDIRLLGQRDGVDLAIDLRARHDVPSIFVSAHDDPATRQRAAAARPLGWIAKPVVAARLPELILNLAASRN